MAGRQGGGREGSEQLRRVEGGFAIGGTEGGSRRGGAAVREAGEPVGVPVVGSTTDILELGVR